MTCHGWQLHQEGAICATSSIRSITDLGTGSGWYPRQLYRSASNRDNVWSWSGDDPSSESITGFRSCWDISLRAPAQTREQRARYLAHRHWNTVRLWHSIKDQRFGFQKWQKAFPTAFPADPR